MCNDISPTCYTWFRSIWNKYLPDLICWNDRGCDECDRLLARLNHFKKLNDNPSVHNVMVEYDIHRHLCKAIHDEVDELHIQSRLFNSNLAVLWSDHWGVHYFIAEKRSLVEYKLISTSGVLGVNFSAIWNGTRKKAEYIIYTLPFSEDSNIICNHFWDYLINYRKEYSHVNHIIIASDSHSTQRSNLTFAFFDYLIRVKKLFGDEGQVTLYFYHPGHHDHAGDRAHAKCQECWTRYLHLDKKICDPVCIINDVMSSLTNYKFIWKMGFFDFLSWLSGCYVEIPSISSVHVANFSKLGII